MVLHLDLITTDSEIRQGGLHSTAYTQAARRP
eukprot:COSAG02_NODE_17735_length_984_cov_4.492655_1_plen_31_part_10